MCSFWAVWLISYCFDHEIFHSSKFQKFFFKIARPDSLQNPMDTTKTMIKHHCFSKSTYHVCWYTFKNSLISIYINHENENCVKTTVANQCTWVRITCLKETFLSLRPSSKKYRIYNKYLLSLKGYRFRRCNSLKVYIFLWYTWIYINLTILAYLIWNIYLILIKLKISFLKK